MALNPDQQIRSCRIVQHYAHFYERVTCWQWQWSVCVCAYLLQLISILWISSTMGGTTIKGPSICLETMCSHFQMSPLHWERAFDHVKNESELGMCASNGVCLITPSWPINVNTNIFKHPRDVIYALQEQIVNFWWKKQNKINRFQSQKVLSTIKPENRHPNSTFCPNWPILS